LRSSRRPRLTLAGQFLILQLVVIGLVLGVVAAITVQQSTTSFRTDQGSRMQAVADRLAQTSIVRERIDEPDAARELAPPVEQSLSLSGASEVSVAAPDGTVIASSNPASVGRSADLGESLVQQGRAWRGDVEDSDGRSVAGHAPVLDDSGALIALALVENRYPSRWQLLRDAVPDLLLFLGLGAALGVLGSSLLARLIKRRTRGLEPREIATLADHREALLHSIREGVIGVGTDHTVTVLNDSACELLGLTPDAVGRHVADLDLDPTVAELLVTGRPSQDAVVVVGDRLLVLNQRPASSGGRGIGTVTTLRDRTELAAMHSQLSANLTITDALRAQTHEFANQLHTISGLVQLQEYGEVQRLVGVLTRRRAQISDHIAAHVKDPAVAALLVAKTSVAAESGVDLRLASSSDLGALDPALSADLTTILGNLIDNAIDACRDRSDPQVGVVVESTAGLVRVTVTDNGPGVPPELTDRIFARGFSTKPADFAGRGIGLALVKLICSQRGGRVWLHNGDGAEFVIEVPLEAMRDEP
jgi:sensor histidine kinase regulating citrate/malate metabolism